MKQIIILESLGTGRVAYRVCLWADVPVARQPFYADATKGSAYRDASAGELAALRSGAVVERVETFSADPGTSPAEMKARLIQLWQAFQDKVANTNPWNNYGGFWDGQSWAAGGVS